MNGARPALFAAILAPSSAKSRLGTAAQATFAAYVALACAALSMSQASARRSAPSPEPATVALLGALKLAVQGRGDGSETSSAPEPLLAGRARTNAPAPEPQLEPAPSRRKARAALKPSEPTEAVAAVQAVAEVQTPEPPVAPTGDGALERGSVSSAGQGAVGAGATAGTAASGSGTSIAAQAAASGGGAAAGRAQRVEVLPFTDGMSRPELRVSPPPVYTREAREARVEGLVLAKCVITVQGRLENCRILKGLPLMDRAVLKALSSWQYSPVLYRGKPVNVDYVIRLRLAAP